MAGSTGIGGGSVGLGGFSVPLAGELAGAGGDVVPPGTGALVWEFVPGKFLPSDNLDARSCIVVGGLVDGILYGQGRTINVGFTTAGGKPTVGQRVWLASSQDDANTGRGKATATQPTTVMPVYPLFTQNIVDVGICIDNSHYDVDGTCEVRLALPSHPNYVTPSDQTFNLHRATNLVFGSSTITHGGTLADSSWQNNQSIWVAFTVDQIATTAHESVWTNAGSGTGWSIFVDSGVSMVNQGAVLKALGTPRPGLNVVCCTRTGGTFRGSLNGGPVQTMADNGAAPGAGALLTSDYTRGGLCSAVFINRALTDLELTGFASWNCLLINNSAAPVNFFGPPPALIADSSCRSYLDLTSWSGGAINQIAGPAGPGFAWTIDGTGPTSTPFSYTWRRNPAPLYLDGPLPSYDSKHLARDRQLQRIAFTANTVFDVSLIIAGFSLDDTDNGDESALAILINGTVLAPIGAAEDGVTRYSPLWDEQNVATPLDTLAGLTPPYHVEIIISDKITRIDTFDSGGSIGSLVYSDAVTFDTSATAKRLVVLGDGETYGGHSADLPGGSVGGGAVVQRARSDYPGRVSGFGVQATQSILKVLDWGNASALPYADYVVQYAHEGAPATVVYLLGFGFMDWFEPAPLTVADFTTGYAQLLDRLHAQDGAAAFCIAKPVQTDLYPNLNTNGESLQQFADAVGALQAVRPWLTLVDLTTPNAIAFSGFPLAINPSQPDGQIALTANMKAAPAPLGW